MREDPLARSLAEKVLEAIERTEHLVSRVPPSLLEWRPKLPTHVPEASDLGHLLSHLLECLSGFCAAFYRAFPVELADFLELRAIAIGNSCSPIEAQEKIKLYQAQIQRGFRCCKDSDLSTRIPTIFVPEGQTLLAVLLGNLEHLNNHKYQLFFYLKLAGQNVGSRDIYRWRDIPGLDAQATVEPE
jgi:DinB superfamily